MKLWMSTSQMMKFLKLLHEVGDSDALVVNVVDNFRLLMDQSFQACYALFLVMMCSWSEIKKDILPKSVKDGKVTQWLTERAHEEGMRPVDVMLTSGPKIITPLKS